MPESEAAHARCDAITVVLKMYDLHYKATIVEGARRPFRLVWNGNKQSTRENTFRFGSGAYSDTGFGNDYDRNHYFATLDLLDDFAHKMLRKLGLQGV